MSFTEKPFEDFRREKNTSNLNHITKPEKRQQTELFAYDAFYSKLRSCNPIETEHTDQTMLTSSKFD